MIDLDHRDGGVNLPVRAYAGSRQNHVGGEQDGALKVHVTQAPEKGKANKAIIALLAKELRLRKSQITLAAGETSPHKRFWIADETSDSLREKLRQLESS